MKLQKTIIITSILSILLLSNQKSKAEENINCLNTNHNPVTTGPFINTDCISYTTNNTVSLIFSPSHLALTIGTLQTEFDQVHLFDINGLYGALSNCEFTTVCGINTGMEILYGTGEIPEGNYAINYFFSGDSSYYPQISFYVSEDQKFYIEQPESSLVESTGLSFGIAIIITLLSIAFIAYFYNTISSKKPWKK